MNLSRRRSQQGDDLLLMAGKLGHHHAAHALPAWQAVTNLYRVVEVGKEGAKMLVFDG
jgi:hypothetical protein